MLNYYNIETKRLKKSEIYYLKKSIRLNGKVYSVRTRIGNTKPDSKETEKLISTPNLTLEKKILEKRTKSSNKNYAQKYLDPSEILRLEKSKYWNHFFNLFLTKPENDYIEETRKIEYIHGTTAIEGNTFSLQQVDDLINKEIIPTSKTLREINEIQNYIEVDKYMKKYSGKVTLNLIQKLHEIIMTNMFMDSAGNFRRIDTIGIRGLDQAVSPAILIESELENILNDYYSNMQNQGHPFEEAIIFHYKFELIHPFIDGNGRVGREILNYMLQETGFPALIIPLAKRENYLNALYHGNNGEYHQMIQGFIELLHDNREKIFNEITKEEH